MCSFRRSRTLVVFQMTPSLFDPCERLSTDFAIKAFNITVLSFMGTQVSGVWIFIRALVTFMFGCAVVRQVGIQFRFLFKSFSTLWSKTNPVTNGLVGAEMFLQLALELKSFVTDVTLYHGFKVRIAVLQHTRWTRKESVAIIAFDRGVSIFKMTVHLLLCTEAFTAFGTWEFSGSMILSFKLVFHRNKSFVYRYCSRFDLWWILVWSWSSGCVRVVGITNVRVDWN